MKYRDLVKLVEEAGWVHESTRGCSHMQYTHPTRLGKLTIPGGGNLSRDVPPGTLNSILKQAGLK
ncbi:MAG: type II toxin-antitoxin system HicA family toxin [Pirellulales bacterium]